MPSFTGHEGSKVVEFSYRDDLPNKELAGKTEQFMVSVREFRSATQGAVGVELLSWFCFITGQEAGLAVTGVELIRN